jgi:integrase-like protein/helix-turn-helix protein
LEYRSRKAAKDAPVVARMKKLSTQYPRYGYRRIRIFLDRDGHRMSPGRAHRLWQTARLQVPRKRPRKRIAAAARPRPQAPSGPNQVWSYDFVFDHCANGQQLKCLTVTDEFTKEGLAIDVDGRIRSARVIEVLSRLVSARGAPEVSAQRQRAGVRVQGTAVVDRRARHRYGIDRTRQALAEWRRGELQRQVPRRVSEPRMVSFARRGEGSD